MNPPASTEDAIVALLSLNDHEIQAPEHMDVQGSFGSDNENTVGIKRKWDGEKDIEESGMEKDDFADEDEKDGSSDTSDKDEGENISYL